MGQDLSTYVDPVIDVLINAAVIGKDTNSKIPSQRITTIAPNYNSGELDSSLNTLTLIPKILEESEGKLKSKDYATYLSLLQRASNLGSAFAAAKLGFLYLNGLYLNGLQGSTPTNNISTSSSSKKKNKYIISPNYELSAQNYFLALKLINLIHYTLWDMNLLLDVIVNVTELYRYQFDRVNDFELWDNGLTILKRLDSTLNDVQFIKFQTNENNQVRKAIKVHVLFILALTHELDCNFNDAMGIYQDCERIGYTSVSYSADKLIKKSHTSYRLLQEKLDKKIPNVLPICVQCNFEPKGTKEIWRMQVCAKCRRVACCSRECLQFHISDDH